MKKTFWIFTLMILTKLSFAQVELKATMGINLITLPSLNNYINQIPDADQLASFNTAAVFAIETGYFFNHSFEAGIEIPYQIYSYSTHLTSGQYDIYFDELLPSLMAYYVISESDYNFKFGGGLGPRFVFVTEEKKWLGTSDQYNSIGFGGLIRIEGNTSLAKNLYANIGVDMRYDITGEPEDSNGDALYNIVDDENVNFNSFSVGIKLGISYIIGGNN
jgi:hypothetical protein